MPGWTFARPATLFYSYAHEDEAYVDCLERNLSQLQREGLITSWHRRTISPGAIWVNEIDKHLNTADIILLLISADFLASDYCYETEMQRALQRQKMGEACVIPILLRPCHWSNAPFGTLQALPRNGKPISTWDNQDEAFTHIAWQFHQFLKHHPFISYTTTQARKNRERMHQRLQQWYQDYVADSLCEASWLTLDLIEKPDALYHPLATSGVHPSEHPLPGGTSIVRVYEDAHQELLILGQPGAGKSTLLYTLALHLLNVAEKNFGEPLPFIFSLTSWARKRASLEEWMTEELVRVYQVPKRLALQWIATRQVIPLLDGLDEMDENFRSLCVQAINIYHQEHLQPLVVCSRSAEYTVASHTERLVLQRAVVIQSLTPTQIMTILSSFPPLLAMYRTNFLLQGVFSSPLILNLLILTYQSIDIHALSTQEAFLQHIWEQYVQRVITRKGDLASYPLFHTIHWLSYLAKQMYLHNDVLFDIESLQSSWLPVQMRLHYSLSLMLSSFLIIGICILASFFLLSGQGSVVLCMICMAPIFGPIFWSFIVSKLDEEKISLAEQVRWSWKYICCLLFISIGIGIGIGVIGLVIFTLLVGLVVWLNKGLSYGLHIDESILSIGGQLLSIGVPFGLIIGIIIGCIGLFGGLRVGPVIERKSLSPGEGVNRSLKNGILVALIFGIAVGLGAWLVYRLLGANGYATSGGLFFGMIAGVIGGLISGLHALLQHIFLRFWLWRSNRLPLRVGAFLEDTRARHLLKRVGGTYQFIHRSLLDYFASLP